MLRTLRRVLPAILSVGLLSLLPARLSAQISPWTQSGQGPQHTGFSPIAGPQTGALDWVCGGGARSVVIGSDAIYDIGDGLQARGFDGGLKWRITGAFQGTPAVGLDESGVETVYVSGNDNLLYAINPHAGQVDQTTGNLLNAVKWTYQAGGSISGSPTIASDGSVLFTSGDKYVYHVNSDRSLRRRLAPAGSAKFGGTVALGTDNTIYAISSDNSLYAFTFAGILRWKYKASAVPTDPIVGVGTDGTDHVYFTARDYSLWSVSAPGVKKWNISVGPRASRGDSSICLWTAGFDPVTRSVFAGGRDGFYAYTAAGVQRWKVSTTGMTGLFSRPTIGYDSTTEATTVYFSRRNTTSFPSLATVYAVDVSSGASLWSRPVLAWSDMDAAIDADGALYVGGQGLCCFLDGGRERPTIRRFVPRLMNGQLELWAVTVWDTDPGAIAVVEYFLDSDNDGIFTPGVDEKVGEQTTPQTSDPSYRLLLPPPASGTYRFFGVATDDDGNASNLVSGTYTQP